MSEQDVVRSNICVFVETIEDKGQCYTLTFDHAGLYIDVLTGIEITKCEMHKYLYSVLNSISRPAISLISAPNISESGRFC